MVSATAGVMAKGPQAPRNEERPWPQLREDLRLFPSEAEDDGISTWVLHDPLSDRFFRLSWIEVEILGLMDRGSASAVAREATTRTGQMITGEDVEKLLQFIEQQHLVRAVGDLGQKRLDNRAALLQKGRFKRLARQYLFLRVPLFRPDRFLEKTLHLVQWAFHPWVRHGVLLAGLLGLFLALRQVDAFIATALDFLSLQGIFWYAITIIGVKILHELAHAYTAKRAGCHVSTIGVAILVFWPVMYTDVTHAWKLRQRRERLAIGAAGMLFELAVACLALLAWGVLPDGFLRDAAFVLATASWITTLTVNLNPLLRFDGYYLLSDLWRIPNLQERSLALLRWKTAQFLLGLDDPPPETPPPLTRRKMLIYASAVTAYRFMLTILICAVIYALFFKLMALFLITLMLTQSWITPLLKGIAFTYNRRTGIHWGTMFTRTLPIVIMMGFALFYPWHSIVTAPAMLHPVSHSTVYAPLDGKLVEIYVEPGRTLKSGQKMGRLEAPDMSFEVADLQRRIEAGRWQISVRAFDPTLLDRSLVLESELYTNMEQLRARQAEMERNRLTAPIDGRITHMMQGMTEGSWIGADESLFVMIDDRRWSVIAYVAEDNLGRIEPGMHARFYPERSGRPPFDVSIDHIEATALRELDNLLSAAPFGGGIPVRHTEDDRMVPTRAFYRVTLTPTEGFPPPDRILRGTVSIKGHRQGFAQRITRHIMGLLRREGGF